MINVLSLTIILGIVGRSVGLPDVHSGYGFAIGNMAAFDMEVALLQKEWLDEEPTRQQKITVN